LQLPVDVQWTRQAPRQSTLQLLTESQVTSLSAPTRGAQFPVLLQA
jgi:hypothetical protein